MFDSHFHLTDPRLITEFAARTTVPNGVEIGASFEELPQVFEFAKGHQNIWCTAGVHPAYAEQFSLNDFENFVVSNLSNEKFIAIGECGLDFHRADLPDRNLQIAVFTAQIEIAGRYHKPLVVHSREAWEDTAAILIANQDKLSAGVLIHCMSYTAADAAYLMAKMPNVKIYFAFGGHLTYKNKTYLQDTLRAIPLDRILIETDAPYLAPVPMMGQINQPEYIKYTAQKMAEVLNLTVADVEDLTTRNAREFFQRDFEII